MKKLHLIQFNKISGTFISILPIKDYDILNKEYFVYKEAEIDPFTEVIQGTADNFTIAAKVELPMPILESAMNDLAKSKIFKEYTVEQQLSVLIDTIAFMLDKNSLSFNDFTEMKSYIDEIKRTNSLRKESFSQDENFNYISKQSEYQQNNDILDGGLHEAIGPRVPSETFISGSSAGI